MLFNTQSGEVITFLKVQLPHLCVYNSTRDQRYTSVTKCTVNINCLEKRKIVEKSSRFFSRCHKLFLCSLQQDVVFM